MRDVLFRGKRVDNGEWVYGDVIHNGVDADGCLVEYKEGDSLICMVEIQDKLCLIRAVYSDTVGQYTGLMDKNGVKIFDGDRVIVPMYRMENHVPNFMKGTVEWRNGAFHVTWDDEKYGRHFLGYLQDVEVIGNIQENQEMLTGDGQCS